MLINFLKSSRASFNLLVAAFIILNATYLHSAIKNPNTESERESIVTENSDGLEVDSMEFDDITYRNLQALQGNPDYILEHRQRLEYLRQESMANQLIPLDITYRAPSYLFQREGSGFGIEQNPSQAKKVHGDLKKKKLSKINFDSALLNDSVYGHTCSAMALDFLSRYIKECSNFNKYADFKRYVENFKPFYRNSNETYTSRQAAYNTIQADRKVSLADPELMKFRKMQSLSNYHGLKLTSVTKSINNNEISIYPEKFMGIIDALANGYYVIRALSPTDNYKMEYYGHTMILIKGKVFSVYYDNSDGAVEITNDVSGYVKDKLIAWGIPEVKIYEAKHDPLTEFNLSTEVIND